MKKIFLLILKLMPLFALGQATIKINTVPERYTPILDTIFISGTFNGWSANDTAYRMIPDTNDKYHININAALGSTVEYKFTRGKPANIETDKNGTDIPNRSFVFSNGLQINDTVEGWKDMAGTHTAIGNTKILDLDFAIPQLSRQRRIWVYLPTNYYASTDSFPVIYMQDGQYLFDNAYTFSGEWGIDESMDSLAAVFSPKAIVVGIDNGASARLNEYSPWINTTYGGGEGNEYVSFICNTLKPFIDSYFRTLPGRSNTCIMGSSMGGFISLYGAIKRQDIFGKAGIFSPVIWFSDSIYQFIQSQGHQHEMKIYFVCGALEDSSMISDMQSVYDTLLSSGFNSSEMNLKTSAGGQHNELFWGREYPFAFKWLFSSSAEINNKTKASVNIRVYPNPANNEITIETTKQSILSICNLNGQELIRQKIEDTKTQVDIRNLTCGIYFLKLITNEAVEVRKIIIK
ncbi:MAG: alpha/beta hydrolase-fold protein [Bacteroidales bacterium]|nr:alpha/beta hydrolase-fold protein [Bacteroidales bacterium]